MKPLTGSKFLAILLGSFAVVLAANGLMLAKAVGTFSGLETEHAYEKGLAFNQTLAEAQAQAALGWHLTVNFTPQAPSKGALAVTLRDRQGALLDKAAVTVHFLRPTSAGHDFDVALAPQGKGVYTGPVEAPLAGAWNLRIDAAADGKAASFTDRLTIK